MKNFYVIEGVHKDPNQIETILKETEKKYGPFDEQEANQVAKGLIKKILMIFIIGHGWSRIINLVILEKPDLFLKIFFGTPF